VHIKTILSCIYFIFITYFYGGVKSKLHLLFTQSRAYYTDTLLTLFTVKQRTLMLNVQGNPIFVKL